MYLFNNTFTYCLSYLVDFSTATLGPNEISGFVHNKNVEPVTFHPDMCHKGNQPGWMTNRPTGVSIFKTDYNRYGRPYVSCLYLLLEFCI